MKPRMIHHNKFCTSSSLCVMFEKLLCFTFKNPPNLIINKLLGITMLVKPRKQIFKVFFKCIFLATQPPNAQSLAIHNRLSCYE